MRYCKHCGSEVPDRNTRFCGFCGKPLDYANNGYSNNSTSSHTVNNNSRISNVKRVIIIAVTVILVSATVLCLVSPKIQNNKYDLREWVGSNNVTYESDITANSSYVYYLEYLGDSTENLQTNIYRMKPNGNKKQLFFSQDGALHSLYASNYYLYYVDDRDGFLYSIKIKDTKSCKKITKIENYDGFYLCSDGDKLYLADTVDKYYWNLYQIDDVTGKANLLFTSKSMWLNGICSYGDCFFVSGVLDDGRDVSESCIFTLSKDEFVIDTLLDYANSPSVYSDNLYYIGDDYCLYSMSLLGTPEIKKITGHIDRYNIYNSSIYYSADYYLWDGVEDEYGVSRNALLKCSLAGEDLELICDNVLWHQNIAFDWTNVANFATEKLELLKLEREDYATPDDSVPQTYVELINALFDTVKQDDFEGFCKLCSSDIMLLYSPYDEYISSEESLTKYLKEQFSSLSDDFTSNNWGNCSVVRVKSESNDGSNGNHYSELFDYLINEKRFSDSKRIADVTCYITESDLSYYVRCIENSEGWHLVFVE